MKNIFENAYFGKPYKTRDGRKAILLSLSDVAVLSMELDNPPYIASINIICDLNGKVKDKFLSSNQDIISEWEIFDKEKELKQLDMLRNKYEKYI